MGRRLFSHKSEIGILHALEAPEDTVWRFHELCFHVSQIKDEVHTDFFFSS
jgi:hypothetical protein